MQIMNGLWWCWTMMSPRSRGRVASCLTRRTNGLAGSCLTEKPMSNHSRTPCAWSVSAPGRPTRTR